MQRLVLWAALLSAGCAASAPTHRFELKVIAGTGTTTAARRSTAHLLAWGARADEVLIALSRGAMVVRGPTAGVRIWARLDGVPVTWAIDAVAAAAMLRGHGRNGTGVWLLGPADVPGVDPDDCRAVPPPHEVVHLAARYPEDMVVLIERTLSYPGAWAVPTPGAVVLRAPADITIRAERLIRYVETSTADLRVSELNVAPWPTVDWGPAVRACAEGAAALDGATAGDLLLAWSRRFDTSIVAGCGVGARVAATGRPRGRASLPSIIEVLGLEALRRPGAREPVVVVDRAIAALVPPPPPEPVPGETVIWTTRDPEGVARALRAAGFRDAIAVPRYGRVVVKASFTDLPIARAIVGAWGG